MTEQRAAYLTELQEPQVPRCPDCNGPYVRSRERRGGQWVTILRCYSCGGKQAGAGGKAG